jgi:nitric oxide reductase large subunit
MAKVAQFSPTPQDKTTRVLIIILIFTIIGCWLGMIWSTIETYRKVAPIPAQFVNSTGKPLMTKADIVDGKAGFQKADLMDYGSLYGMGSYYGEDYTALFLVQLGQRTNAQLAMSQFNKPFNALTAEQQYAVLKQCKKICVALIFLRRLLYYLMLLAMQLQVCKQILQMTYKKVISPKAGRARFH